jgi:hypothetical protein
MMKTKGGDLIQMTWRYLCFCRRQRQRRLVFGGDGLGEWWMVDGLWVDKGKRRPLSEGQKRARQRVFGSEGLANLLYPLRFPKLMRGHRLLLALSICLFRQTVQKPVISSLSLSSSLRWHWHFWLVRESPMLEE